MTFRYCSRGFRCCAATTFSRHVGVFGCDRVSIKVSVSVYGRDLCGTKMSAGTLIAATGCSAIAVAYGPLTPQQVLVLAREHELPVLVVHGGRCDDDAVVVLRLQAGDRERRVQGVPGVHLGHEGAGQLKEADEHLADEMREQGSSRCGERQHLEAMYNRRDMSVLARPDGVVVHRVIVHRDRLEGRGMGVRQGAAGGPEHLADTQVVKRPGGDDQERVGVEVGNSSHHALSVVAILDTFIVKRVIALVDGLEHKGAFRSVSVVTTAPAISHDGSITLHRPPRTLPTRSSLTQAVAQRLVVCPVIN